MPGVVGLTDLVEKYFYSNQWLWIFICSIVYLFFRVDTAGKRAFVAILVVFIFFVNSYIIEKFTALGENATFYRHLWAIPSIVIIGIAIVDLIKNLPRWYLRIPAIAVLMIGLWFVNNNEYIRLRDLPVSTDGRMVSQNIVDLVEEFEKYKKETDKNTIFVVSDNQATELALLSGFLNVSSSSIIDNSLHDGKTELMSDTPNVSYIMSSCCSKGMDFVIISRQKNTEEAFRSKGHEPTLVTDSYILYKCEGYEGYKQDLNNWGQMKTRTWVDEKGNPTMCSDGYSTVKYEYDRLNNISKESYYDEQGKPCVIASGCAAIQFEYDANRYCTKETYLDMNGNKIENGKGYASVVMINTSYGAIESIRYFDANDLPVYVDGCAESRREYDVNHLLIRESYYDENGQPMNRIDGYYASRDIIYQENNIVLKERYYDTSGNLVNNNFGYATYFRDFDENNRTLQEWYVDAEGNEVSIDDVYSAYQRTYDERGDLMIQRYLVPAGDPFCRSDYDSTQVCQEFNENNQIVKETYWDEKGKPVSLPSGEHGFSLEYDEKGNVITITFLDEEDNEKCVYAGYSRIKREYRESGRMFMEYYFSFETLLSP